MTEQEQELIDRYLKYIRKRRTIISITILLFIFSSIFLFNLYIKNINQSNETYINEEKQENTLNEITNISINNTSQTEITKENNQEKQEETKENTTTQQKITENNEKVVKTPQSKPPTSSIKKEQTITKTKPSNKDFLFVDGYTMENVSQIAQEYLKSSGYAGECIPLKDDEGIYIGMRVFFY